MRRPFKSNSTGSIMMQSTINAPNVKLIIRAVATILHSNITDDMLEGKIIPITSDLYYFSEDKYINENPDAYSEERISLLRKPPTQDDIASFIEAIYDLAQFSAECCVICLVYINRINSITELPILPVNWRPLTIISLMIAQKAWDDKYLSNADFSCIYQFFDTQQYNMLEMKFLDIIQYNTFVKFSLYTKYYLELKSLVPEDFPLKPMDVYTMGKLEKQTDTFGKTQKIISQTSKDSKDSGKSSTFIIS